MNNDDLSRDEFTRDARDAMDRLTHQLNAQELHRLRDIRTSAMARRRGRAWGFTRTAWSGLAVAATVVLAVTLWPAQKTAHHPPLLDDIELLSSEESLELYDDLEFYAWLADENTNRALPGVVPHV